MVTGKYHVWRSERKINWTPWLGIEGMRLPA